MSSNVLQQCFLFKDLPNTVNSKNPVKKSKQNSIPTHTQLIAGSPK